MLNIEGDITVDKLDDVLDQHIAPIYWFLAVLATLGGFLIGYDGAITASALVFIPFKLGTIGIALFISAFAAIAGLAALFSGPFVDMFGRKSLLIVDGLLFGIASLMSALSVNSAMLILSRLLIGFSIGMDYAVAPVYLAEFAQAERRGRLLMWQQVLLFVGGTLAFVSGYFLSFLSPNISWRLMFAIGAIPAFLLAGLRTLLPESPRWLAAKGRMEDAKKSLKRLQINLTGKITALSSSVDQIVNKKPVRTLVIPIIGIWIFFEIFSGINSFVYYSPYIFVHLGFGGSKSILLSLILRIIAATAFIVTFLIIDKGIKRLAAIGFCGLSVGMVMISYGATQLNTSEGIIIIFVGILIFFWFFQLSMGQSEVVLMGTAFPRRVRGLGSGMFAFIAYETSFINTFIFPFWLKSYGFSSFAAFEAFFCIAGVVWSIFVLREVSGVPLEQISDKYAMAKPK